MSYHARVEAARTLIAIAEARISPSDRSADERDLAIAQVYAQLAQAQATLAVAQAIRDDAQSRGPI